MKKRKIRKNKYILVIPFNTIYIFLSFFLSFAAYIYTLCPTVSAYADAGEFPTFAYISGFGHPSGYPLTILIQKLFILFPFGNVAMKANMSSVFIASITVVLFYLLMKLIIKNYFIAFISSFILAFSKIFWRNALVAEVFSLVGFFVVLTLFLYLLWEKTKEIKYFYLFLLVSGFGIFHHHTISMSLFPLLLVFIFTKQWKQLNIKNIILGIILVLSGSLQYLYIFFFASHLTFLMNWNNPTTLGGLFELITRQSYGTFTLTVLWQNVDILSQIIGISKHLLESFGYVGILLMSIGVLYAVFNKHIKILFICLFGIVSLYIFAIFTGIPIYQPVQVQYVERFQIISSIYISILTGFGLLYVYNLRNKLSKNLFKIIIILLICLVPVLIVKINYFQTNQRNNYFAQNLADDILLSVSKNSIFLMEEDAVINTMFYNRFVLGKRPDVCYIVSNMLTSQTEWYLDELEVLCPDLVFPNKGQPSDEYLINFITLNSQKKNIFFHIPDLEHNLEIEIPKVSQGLVWQYLPYEYHEEVFINIETEILNYINKYKNLNNPKTYHFEWPEYTLMLRYAEPYIYLAQLNHKDLKKSEKYYIDAIKVTPYNSIPYLELGDDYDMHGDKIKAIEYWKKALERLSANETDLVRQLNNKISASKSD